MHARTTHFPHLSPFFVRVDTCAGEIRACDVHSGDVVLQPKGRPPREQARLPPSR